ncbi:radical SAM family heme chaperone HemW [Ruminiclostridium cellulolyticum]|uniref:Heme chaperone HemW n=1 Tax=Ruminiclostridium cellulolyticum (strain ATCC 35319 / DSM 5812 / JCM 6584 / H10) TaxID=394503 RepID=B8I3I5_RUMCH|nr:radical SAM family heme chaperone HemW [Ruminiclostridium cellulolyticum]ACL76328.1 oxygen-independent coproporphyrinogen III oxidase [Ruminiclostridium cellulolyticum H10]
MLNKDRAGLYIHVPFCSSKCNYCDFNSYTGKIDHADNYFKSLKKEIELYKAELRHYIINTIFIGGGTPSVVNEQYILEILEKCRTEYNISENCEISIESNPGTLSNEKLKAYKNAGINRISIGLQAYQDKLLKYLGRCHSHKDFTESVKNAKSAGFENINGDIIFGIPGQSLGDWKETLDYLVSLGINHISAYSLKIEEETKFGRMEEQGSLVPVEDELDREMYHYAVDYLNENGLKQYEISNFAKEGYECKHNLIYWKCVDYLGLGAGAHSCLKNTRFSNQISIEGYIDYLNRGEKPLYEKNPLEFTDKMSEYMFLGLRLTAGVSGKEFYELFNRNMFTMYKDIFARLENKSLIKITGDTVKLTRLGLDLANQVFLEFV